jgi:serine/threonine protein kinase
MDLSSYEFTASDPAWSAVASILPSVVDPITLPDMLIDQDAIYRACEVFGLPSVLGLEVGLPPSLIGAGASYQVYAQKLDEWDRMVAVKHIRSAVSRGNIEEVPSAWIQQATVLREIYSLCLFNDHPNFVTLLAWGTRGVGADINLFLVTDFAPLGSLDCFLREHGSKLVASQLLKICADIAEGVQAMHSQRMAHGDVKTANVLIFEDPRDKEQYTAKISDLGFSLSLDFDEPEANYRGTDLYNAPEIRGQRSTRLRDLDALACDVYSFGLLVWTVLKLGRFFLGDVPDLTLQGKGNVEVRDAVEASQLLEYAMEFAQSGIPQCEAEMVGRLFSGSLQVDPSSRLPMKSLCAIFPPKYRQ